MIEMDREGQVVPDGWITAWEEDNFCFMLHDDYFVVVEEFSRIH